MQKRKRKRPKALEVKKNEKKRKDQDLAITPDDVTSLLQRLFFSFLFFSSLYENLFLFKR